MRKGNYWQRLVIYMRPCDGRYEEIMKGTIARNILDDLTAALVLAAVAIPLAMGFAMASGLRPEQGIIGGAIASLFGAIFGGSKYLVHGPSAAFIPVTAGLMASYDTGFLILALLIAGVMLLLSGFFRIGRIVEKLPYSIIVGFTIGIALIIIFSQIGPALGFKEKTGYNIIDHTLFAYKNINRINFSAVAMVVLTIVFCKTFEKLSAFIPGPVPALVFGYFGAKTFWTDKGLILVGDQYGNIMGNLFAFTPPSLQESWNSLMVFDLACYGFTFFIISSIESLVYGRAADRLAHNSGFPFSSNRELRGLGMTSIFSALFNGLPQSANLGRTALNIRIKGRSPLTGISRSAFIVLIAILVGAHLEKIPMACIAGILLYVAGGMIKKREIIKIARMNNYHVILMCYTIAAVPLFGFMSGVLSAIIIYVLCFRSFEKKKNKEPVHKKRHKYEKY
ncbi:MAG TPA: SulP family inorganic anion transporter [Chitinophagaceae bacterium]